MPERFDEDDLGLFTFKVILFILLMLWTAGAFIVFLCGM